MKEPFTKSDQFVGIEIRVPGSYIERPPLMARVVPPCPNVRNGSKADIARALDWPRPALRVSARRNRGWDDQDAGLTTALPHSSGRAAAMPLGKRNHLRAKELAHVFPLEGPLEPKSLSRAATKVHHERQKLLALNMLGHRRNAQNLT